jgi:hypothetical protein
MSALAQTNGPTNAPINYTGLNVGSSMWNAPVPIFWGMRRLSTNAIWFNHFTAKDAGGKGKGGGGKTQQQKTYSAAVALGLCEGVVDSVTNIWANGSTTTTTSLAALNMTFFPGTASQAPWSYVTTSYPAQARAYSQLCYLGCPSLALGESASIPDNAFECLRTSLFAYVQSSSGWINPSTHVAFPGRDCLMSDIIADFLTNPQYGMGFAAGDLGPMTQYAAYQQAQGLFFSPLLVSQQKATEILDRWAQLSNSWIYWSGEALQFVPLGDSVVTGNGVTYTPAQDVAYDLGLADFIAASGPDEGPVKVSRIDPADAHNRTVLSITDRTLGYIDNPFEWKDDGLVDQYGLRDSSSTQGDEICDPNVARIAVQLLGKRAAYVRNSYAFKTSYRYILCLPGTILTLSEPNIGLDHVRVRVKSISEDDSGQLSFVCEEFPGTAGTYVAPLSAAPANSPANPNAFDLPGPVNTPAILEPNSAYTGGVAKIIIAASGGASWGGCTVNVSFNGSDYSQIGVIESAARQGVLTAALPAFAGVNPDTADTLAVDCGESLAAPLTSIAPADAIALRTLALIAAQPTIIATPPTSPYLGASLVPTGGELLAFGGVALTGTYAANLTYLVRGQYGTSAGAHAAGDQFTVIDTSGTDGSTVELALPAQYIGQPISLKLCSFNRFGQSLQDPSTVVEYVYYPTGAGYGGGAAGVPTTPSGLAATPGTTQVGLAWAANPAADNVTGYSLYRAAGTGASFGSATPIWRGLALAYTDASVAASTGYTYFLVANNAVGASPNSAGVSATTGTSTSASTSRLTISASTYGLGAPPALTWYVDVTNTSGGPVAITLPASPAVGQIIVFTDEGGTAGANALTVKNGSTVVGAISVNGGWLPLRWNGANWLQGV